MKDRKDKFKELLDTFGPDKIQDGYQFMLHLDKKQIDFTEFMTFAHKMVKERNKYLKEINKAIEKTRIDIPCPECGNRLVIHTVNTPKGKGNISGWRSLISCVECTYENFSVLKANKRLIRIKRNRRII